MALPLPGNIAVAGLAHGLQVVERVQPAVGQWHDVVRLTGGRYMAQRAHGVASQEHNPEPLPRLVIATRRSRWSIVGRSWRCGAPAVH